MDRKEFLGTSIFFGAAAIAPGCTIQERQKGKSSAGFDLGDFPIFCGHEHWGAIFVIGHSSEGFTADVEPGALPARRVTLVDLLLDPYLSGNLDGIGVSPWKFPAGNEEVDIFKVAADSPAEAYQMVSPVLKDFHLKGTYQCLRRGIEFAYAYDIAEDDPLAIIEAESLIAANYKRMFSWYREMMAKANFSVLMRPVQPEYYFGDTGTVSAREELAFTSTLLRIDPFLDFWKDTDPRRDKLGDQLGIDPADAHSWRKFLEKMFDRAGENGCLGIKQLQAYFRSLDFRKVQDSEVKFRGQLSGNEVVVFQDWVMHECCRLANDNRWPHQIHVGTNNLPASNPLPLEKLATMYPDQKIVMLHCWPYIKEAGYLAQLYSNVYIDTCWQQVLNPAFLMQSLETWLGYIPHNKVTMSNDSTSVEMAIGSSLITREILACALEGQSAFANLHEREVNEIATGFLHNNAVNIYGTGR